MDNNLIENMVLVISLIISALAFMYSYKTSKEFGYKDSILNINNMFLERYSRRVFDSSVEVKVKNEAYVRVCNNLKELRNVVQREYNLKGEDGLENLKKFHKESKIEGSFENKFAYEVSLALQEVGLMTLTGAIPLEFVVSSNGYQIIEDWLYCYELVEQIRKNSMLKKRSIMNVVQYQRIHAEWLSNFSYLYFSINWEGEMLDLYSKYFDSEKINPMTMEHNIRRIENQIIPTYINKKIEKLIRV